MIQEICRKELLENFQSFRFFALFAVTVFLFSVNPFLLSTEYDEELKEYNRNLERHKKSDKSFVVAQRQPNPLSFVAEGGDRDASNIFFIYLDLGIIPKGAEQYGVNVTFPDFQVIDWVFILKVLFSLFPILLTFDAISGEKERGTLALMCSNSVSRADIIMGKYLGALVTAIIPAVAGMLVSMIIVNFLRNTSLTMDSAFRLALVAVMALAYISLFSLLGIVISSVVHRSSVSLLLLLSVWIVLVVVVPNVSGIIAEITKDVLPEHEFARRESESYRKTGTEWQESVVAKRLKDPEELSEELAKFLNKQAERRMQVMDSYINTIHAKEDIVLNISRISPASVFELATAEIINAGVSAQRRFYMSARRWYDLYDGYVREKTGQVRKYMQFLSLPVKLATGERVTVSPPAPRPLPADTSDFPEIPRYNFSISESVMSSLWNIILLAMWNVALFLLSYLFFLRCDVR